MANKPTFPDPEDPSVTYIETIKFRKDRKNGRDFLESINEYTRKLKERFARELEEEEAAEETLQKEEA